MGRHKKKPDERRAKWGVLNPTNAERAAITAAAEGAGLGINEYILTCTRQMRVVRRADREHLVRHLAGIEDRLDEIARNTMAAPISTADVTSLLFALRAIEVALRTGAVEPEDDDTLDDTAC